MASTTPANSMDNDVAGKSFNEEAMWNRLINIERQFEAKRELPSCINEQIKFSNEYADNIHAISFEMEELVNQLSKLEKGELLISMVVSPLMCFFAVPLHLGLSPYKMLVPRQMAVIAMLGSMTFDISNTVLKWLEDRQGDSKISSPRIFGILIKLFVIDKERKWESRFLKLLMKHSNGVYQDDLVFWFINLACYYLSSHEVSSLEEFMQMNDKRVTFLNNCSSADKASIDIDEQKNTYCQKARDWAAKEIDLHNLAMPNPLAIGVARFETAKECFDRLDLAKNMTADLNPHEFDTWASVISTVMSPEMKILNALEKETELHQVKELSDNHLQAYEALKKEQLETLEKFFRTCEEEKKNLVMEALYKTVKYWLSLKEANFNRDEKLSSEDILKRLVQNAGVAFKVDGKLHKAESTDTVCNKECALCFSKFSKKRKRACLDPCGHACACLDCATKAWAKKPNCPWCKAAIKKPIPVPAQLFF